MNSVSNQMGSVYYSVNRNGLYEDAGGTRTAAKRPHNAYFTPSRNKAEADHNTGA
jgi:hypothetical protein